MSENATLEGTESTENMKYGVGDEVTIMRGLDRNKVAKVVGVDKDKRQYAVTFTDGGFAVVNEVNVKPPVEGSVTARQLANLAGQATDLPSFLSLLAKHVDGFAKEYDAPQPE